MSSLSDFLKDSVAPLKGLYAGQPGSNGFWRRDIYRVPGTYTWTAKKSGKIKIQALGAGSGAGSYAPGSSGAYGEKTLSVVAGQQLIIVVGLGGAGGSGSSPMTLSYAGGTTSISGVPIGATPLTLVGAAGIKGDAIASTGAPGYGTGPWDLTNPGAKCASTSSGGPSSGSPFGPGIANLSGRGAGGAGWGGPSRGDGGASSHNENGDTPTGAPGLTADGGSSSATLSQHGKSSPFWDMADADGGGGAFNSTNSLAGIGGIGAGGAQCTNRPGACSVMGGGTGYGNNTTLGASGGFGAGGGACTHASTHVGGKGGDAFVMIFWDEVE